MIKSKIDIQSPNSSLFCPKLMASATLPQTTAFVLNASNATPHRLRLKTSHHSRPSSLQKTDMKFPRKPVNDGGNLRDRILRIAMRSAGKFDRSCSNVLAIRLMANDVPLKKIDDQMKNQLVLQWQSANRPMCRRVGCGNRFQIINDGVVDLGAHPHDDYCEKHLEVSRLRRDGNPDKRFRSAN